MGGLLALRHEEMNTLTVFPLQLVRRLEIVWGSEEIDAYEYLLKQADKRGITLDEFVKSTVLKNMRET